MRREDQWRRAEVGGRDGSHKRVNFAKEVREEMLLLVRDYAGGVVAPRCL